MDFRKLLAGLLACICLATAAQAAPTTIVGPDGLYGAAVDSTGALKITGSLSTSQAAFAPGGSPVTVSAGVTSTSYNFTAGTTVAVSNTGTQTVYVVFGTTSGVTATTATGYPILASQTVFLSPAANTWIAGITASGTSTLLVTPGSGVPAITGGGSSSGGAITIASGGVASGAYATGAITDLGTTADAAYNGSGNASLISIMKGIANGTVPSSTLPIYGQATTLAPSYSNATANYLSLNPTGDLRSVSKVTDGTNTAAVKAASTASAATDPALTVAISPNNLPAANASAFLNDAVATPLQVVALSGSTKIYVSAYSIVAAVAENVKFQYGTGSNCGTGTTDITSNMAFAANGGIAAGSGVAPLFVVPSGNALCVTASTTGPTAVNVSYAQF